MVKGNRKELLKGGHGVTDVTVLRVSLGCSETVLFLLLLFSSSDYLSLYSI